MSSAPRRFRLDPRLLIGSALVLASVLGVVWVVASANETVAIYVAREPIAEGDSLSEDRLALIEVPRADSNELYLQPEQLPQQPVILTRPIGAGELLPISALGLADQSTAQVVVTISGAVPETVIAGAAVELWAALPDERPGTYAPPEILVTQAQVVRVLESQQLVNSGQVELELRIPDETLAKVLAATTNGALLQVVPVYVPVME